MEASRDLVEPENLMAYLVAEGLLEGALAELLGTGFDAETTANGDFGASELDGSVVYAEDGACLEALALEGGACLGRQPAQFCFLSSGDGAELGFEDHAGG